MMAFLFHRRLKGDVFSSKVYYFVWIIIATAIHWFNPLVHLMLKIAGQDLELSCDEEVVGGMSKKATPVYDTI